MTHRDGEQGTGMGWFGDFFINAFARKLLIMPDCDCVAQVPVGVSVTDFSGSVSDLLGVAAACQADAGWPQKCNRLVKPMVEWANEKYLSKNVV